MKKLLLGTSLVALVSSSVMFSNEVKAASATAQALAVVTAAINIVQVSDLDFGSSVQGDGSLAVATGDASAAEFTVSGEPSTAYTITLPADGTIIMQTGAGASADEQIAVDSFVSAPAAGANGLLDGTGSETLKVGATRAALSATQVTGSYTTNFTVDVVY